jgi:hypothetical protein
MPPLMLIKTKANPDSLPIEAFDEICAGVATDASQFWKNLAGGLRIAFSCRAGRSGTGQPGKHYL